MEKCSLSIHHSERLQSMYYPRESRTIFFCCKFSDNSSLFSMYLSLPQAELLIKITVGWKKNLVSFRAGEIKRPSFVHANQDLCDRAVTDSQCGYSGPFPPEPVALRKNSGCLRVIPTFIYAQLSEVRGIQFKNRFWNRYGRPYFCRILASSTWLK